MEYMETRATVMLICEMRIDRDDSTNAKREKNWMENKYLEWLLSNDKEYDIIVAS